MLKQERVAVNVDWDFFFKEDPMWDWGHREALIFLDLMWYNRFESFALSPRLGAQDLEHFYQPNRLYKRFWSKLESLGFDFSQALPLVGDSNIGAWSYFSGVPVKHVYNFDFHHDVAYHDLDKMVECGNWLGQLLKLKKRLTSTIVYPTKQRRDEEFHLPESVDSLVGSRVYATDLRSLEAAPRKVNYLYICRSGCWTPPWADSQYIQFVSQVSNGNKPTWFAELLQNKELDLANPLVPRSWDRAQALEQTEQFLKIVQARREVANARHNDEVQS
mgnify:CR=1 FL=1